MLILITSLVRCAGLETPQGMEIFAQKTCPGKDSGMAKASSEQGSKTKAQLRENLMRRRGRAAPSAPD